MIAGWQLTQRSLLNAATLSALLQPGLVAPENVLLIFIIKLWKNAHFTGFTAQVTVSRTRLVEHELETTFGNKRLLVTTLGWFQILENYFHQYTLNLGSFVTKPTEGLNLTTMKQLPNTRGKRATVILCLETPWAQNCSQHRAWGISFRCSCASEVPELLRWPLWDSFPGKKINTSFILMDNIGSYPPEFSPNCSVQNAKTLTPPCLIA